MRREKPGRPKAEGRRLKVRQKRRQGNMVRLAALALAAVVAAAGGCNRSDASGDLARYDRLKAAGDEKEAAKVLGRVIATGERLYEEKQFKRSVRVFEEVLKREPDKPLVLNYLGLMVGGLGEVEKAIQYFNRAIEIDPLSPQPYWNLAIIYYNRKDYASCEEQLREAIKYARVKAQYRLLYALCAVELKRPKEVIVARLKDVVRAAEAQAHAERPEALAPGGSLATVWKEAAKRLAAYGDAFGYERMRYAAAESPKAEVRAFAGRLLAERLLPERP